jgi:hypothetical protein
MSLARCTTIGDIIYTLLIIGSKKFNKVFLVLGAFTRSHDSKHLRSKNSCTREHTVNNSLSVYCCKLFTGREVHQGYYEFLQHIYSKDKFTLQRIVLTG